MKKMLNKDCDSESGDDRVSLNVKFIFTLLDILYLIFCFYYFHDFKINFLCISVFPFKSFLKNISLDKEM
ncbi:hypothetical protein KUTeg_010155 [Tegillarca granosa]|uniref:Uncharacterized protein n=1 Tax=Tegillarca granosa TaxID=220873 RepID=A0ABQ9F8V7_TEGGR|nr:hypothetical protein KUTeg_010155 [Tegillarca granosa]